MKKRRIEPEGPRKPLVVLPKHPWLVVALAVFVGLWLLFALNGGSLSVGSSNSPPKKDGGDAARMTE